MPPMVEDVQGGWAGVVGGAPGAHPLLVKGWAANKVVLPWYGGCSLGLRVRIIDRVIDWAIGFEGIGYWILGMD